MSCNTPTLRATFDSATLQAVAAQGLIQFPDVTTDSQCNTASGGTITLRRPGTYVVHFNATVSATAADAQEIQLVRNGSVVAGAHAIETAAAAGDLVSLAFTAVVTVTPGTATTLGFRAANAMNIRIANAVIVQE